MKTVDLIKALRDEAVLFLPMASPRYKLLMMAADRLELLNERLSIIDEDWGNGYD